MKHTLFRGACVAIIGVVALLSPPPAGASTQGDCGTWCVYGQACDLELIEMCYTLCTNSHGGACGGSCTGGGVILYCSGDES